MTVAAVLLVYCRLPIDEAARGVALAGRLVILAVGLGLPGWLILGQLAAGRQGTPYQRRGTWLFVNICRAVRRRRRRATGIESRPARVAGLIGTPERGSLTWCPRSSSARRRAVHRWRRRGCRLGERSHAELSGPVRPAQCLARDGVTAGGQQVAHTAE
ncbi:hypothetical protein FRAAL1541 [Frankia alni ACN14a]|uniref:Uncharacterized protein n=1 Tax=Frankia alni (strain DSM 45986 / CECT 9034 / ACN14a) TaxID=326424 RepID=Q0RQH7_FRAAA|nr:hypothetical protein FRAAL1541 [Frankia alni ACN14a]